MQQVRAMQQISSAHVIAQPASSLISSPSLHLIALFFILSVCPTVTLAEVRVVTAQGIHRMGDRDTREDAIRLATEAAKRNALEQVAVYLESITIVDGLDVTKDEIRTYTAGLVLVLEQKTNTTLDEGGIIVTTDLTAQIDTEEVRQAIAALRENEDARHQIVALQQENEQLQQDLNAANHALAQATTSEQTQQAAHQRQDILNRVQSNAMVAQAWTDWVLVSPGSSQILALLSVAQGLYPTNPHIQAAQQVITKRQPPAPPHPPVPPTPGTRPSTMPSHRVTPAPGSQTVPRTLNEITHNTSTTPPHIGNQPGVIPQIAPSLNPLSPSSSAAPPGSQQIPIPGSRSARTLQQFLQPPQTGTSVPSAEQRPPKMDHIRPPTLQQVPRMPRRFGSEQGRGIGRDGSGRGGDGGR
jgi:hypothetical protein